MRDRVRRQRGCLSCITAGERGTAMARVLVVDDERTIRELLRFALECEGHEVTVFRDGAELLTYLTDSGRHADPALPAQAQEPCVVLMDVMMPRMDGWEVCRQLAEHPALCEHLALVLMTAVFQADEAAPVPTPARALLRKPFDLEQVFALVATLALPTMPAPHLAEPCAGPALLAS